MLRNIQRLAAAGVILMAMNSVRGDVDAALSTRLDSILSKHADHGAFYVARVIEVASGRELVMHDVDRPVAPASNCKLANVAAALDRFGPDYAWRTYLAIDGEDLWIIGTGDPSLGDKRIEEKHNQPRFAVLDQFADALLQRGIHSIKGRLLIDDGVFDDQRVGPSWPTAELTDSWCAPLTGLSLNQNCINVTAFADHLEVLPKTAGVQVINLSRNTGDPLEPTIERDARQNVFTVKGLVQKRTELDPKAIVDPGLFLADALRMRLAEKGITIAGETQRASRESAAAKWNDLKRKDQRDARVVAIHETDLRDVIARIDKQSQNLFADALCKLQGQAWDLEHGHDRPGSWAAGSQAVHDFLRRMQIDDSHYVLVDGSGMSADNRVTARIISELLLKMATHRYADEYFNSLSVSGVDGTLDDRMTDLPRMIHAKSGTIDGVKALSGYATTRSSKRLVFSMIFNGIPDGMEHDCQNLLDEACHALVEW